MKLSGWARLWIAVAVTGTLTSCTTYIIEEDPYSGLSDPDPDSSCVLDIRVTPEGRTVWKGEEISDEEYDRRLLAGRINEACVERKKDSLQSP